MNGELLTIQEAAELLSVSTRTLRRWETQGKIFAERTKGNQRRYRLDHVPVFKKNAYYKGQTLSKRVVTVGLKKEKKHMSPFQKHRVIGYLSILSFLIFGLILSYTSVFKHFRTTNISLPAISQNEIGQEVLAAATAPLSDLFAVNVPSEFRQPVSFLSDVNIKGNLQLHSATFSGTTTFQGPVNAQGQNVDLGSGSLTAGNVVYSTTPGTGIGITGGQTPTISNTGVLSLQGSTGALSLTAGTGISISGLTITNTSPENMQNEFLTVSAGGTSFSAASPTDTLNFVAGSGITVAAGSGNKVTITSSATSDTGWQRSSSGFVTLVTSSDSVGIGTSSPSSFKLQVAGSIGPNTTDTYDLGSASLEWNNVYAKNVVTSGPTTGGTLTLTPTSDTTALTLVGTNVATQKLAYFNAKNASGTIFDISYGATQTLTGSLIGQTIDLNNGQVTNSNNSVTGFKVTLPTVTDSNAAGTVNIRGLQFGFGTGSGINQTGAGATVYTGVDVSLPALTQTAGTLTGNGILVTTPSQITTGGTANGINVSASGVGAGTLTGVNIGTITSPGAGAENALSVGSGWDSVLTVNGTTTINGSGVALIAGGGTGQSSYTSGDILYYDSASSTTALQKLAGGASNNGKVLTVSSGLPVWGTISGSSCTDCVVNDPTATTGNTIAPTGSNTTGLIVKQTSTSLGVNTPDIFSVCASANCTGSNKYFSVDYQGNVSTGSIANTTLTLTPTTDTTALTLVGTNVATANLQYINAKNSQGTILNMAYGATQTLSTSTALTGFAEDLSTNVTATNATVAGDSITLPSVTDTHTSGTKTLRGLVVSDAGGLNQNGAGGTLTFAGADITIPALTQSAGTINGYGVQVTTPSSITTGGTAAGLNIVASGVGAGTLNGINISGITGGAGTENAITIGSGWDKQINGTSWSVDGSGNLTVAGCTGCASTALSSITAATQTNTIDTTNKAQTWNWNSLTTETAFKMGSTSLTSGRLFELDPTFAGSAVTGYGQYINGADSTSSGNTDYNLYSTLALSGNAAKTGVGLYGTVSTSSTTADTLYAADFSMPNGAGYSFSRSITIDHTKVGSSDSADFPVLISGTYSYLATVANSGNVQNSNGYDIGFYADSALTTKLNWEVERYNATTGEIEAWVKVPNVSHTNDTVIYMAYGNTHISTFQGNATKTWNSNYVGVWHLPDGTTLSANDSTSNANNGTVSGATATAGEIDGAASFNGSTNFIDVPASTSVNTIGTVGTWELWYKTSSTNNNIWLFGRDTSGTRGGLELTINDSHAVTHTINLQANGQGAAALNYTNAAVNNGNLHHLVAVFNGSTAKLYFDGQLGASGTLGGGFGGFNSGVSIRWAGSTDGFWAHLNGSIDETRVSPIQLSADWILAEYNNQSSPSTFYTVGSATAPTTGSIITTGTRNVYGIRSQPSSTGASTGGTTNVYGGYFKSGGTVGVGGTINSYGLYVANGTMNTTGTTTNYGLYLETPTGATTNYALYSAGGTAYFAGKVGIANTAPGSILTIGTAGSTGGAIDLAGSGSGVVTLNTAASAGTWTLTLPTSGQNANYILSTDGTGVLSWASNGLCTACLDRIPTTTAQNTITPTTNSVVALTVNGTSGTAATAESIVQGGDATALSITGNAATTNTVLSLSGTALTSGKALSLTGPSSGTTKTTALLSATSNVGNTGTTTGMTLLNGTISPTASSAIGVNLNLTTANSNSTNADTAYGLYNTFTDGTALANTDYGNYVTLALSGNAAKTGVGLYGTVSTSSTTADTILAADLATSTSGAVTSGSGSGYTYSRTITIDHTKVGTADSTNFPVLFSGTYSYLADVAHSGNVQNSPNGYDINFFSDAALTTKLSWEVEKYDNTTGEIEAWIKIPTLSHTADTVIYMGYGNAAISTFQGNTNGTWNSNAKGIWHLSDNAANTTVAESTSNANTGTAQANTSTKTVTGQIANALTFNSTTDYVQMTSMPLPTGSGDFTLLGWIKPANNSVRQDFISIGDLVHTNNGVSIFVNTSAQVEADLSNVGGPHSSATVNDGNWHRAAVTFTSGTAQIYVDGTSSGSSQAMSPNLTSNTSYFGGKSNAVGTKLFNGPLDEIQVWTTALPSSWFTADFNNQNSPSTFYAVGDAVIQRNVYGIRSQPSSTGASTGGTTNVYGGYFKSGGTVGVGGTINSYGLYVANGTMNTTGTTTNYGLYLETPTGATTNYTAIIGNSSSAKVGIGDTAPATALSVNGIISGPSSQNLRLQATGSTSGNTNNASIYFLNSSGTTEGRLDTAVTAGGNSYGTLYIGATNTASADLAEYYMTGDSSIEPGDVVSIADTKVLNDANQPVASQGVLQKTSAPYDRKAIGIISTNPGVVLGSIDGDTGIADKRQLALAGRIPTKVSTENGPIAVGDPLTSSSVPGVAQKATKAGQIIGKALESYDSDGIGKIQVFVNLSWYDPDVYLTDTGELQIGSDPSGMFTVIDQNGNAVARAGAFSDAAIANVRAGTVVAQNVTTQSFSLGSNDFTIAGKNINDYVASKTAAFADSSLISSTTLPPDVTTIDLSKNQQFKDLQATVNSLSDRMNSLQNLVNTDSTASAFLPASNSATLASADSLHLRTLNVLGRSVFSDVAINGNITAGTVSVNGLTGSINTTGQPLKLQDNALDGVDILAGKVTIDINGNVKLAGSLTAKTINAQEYDVSGDKTSGSSVLPAGQSSVDVAVSFDSLSPDTYNVLVTPTSLTDKRLNVTYRDKNKFTVSIASPESSDIQFDWWVVGELSSAQ